MINNPQIYTPNTTQKQNMYPMQVLPSSNFNYEAEKKKKQRKKLLIGSLLALGTVAMAAVLCSTGKAPAACKEEFSAEFRTEFKNIKEQSNVLSFENFGDNMKAAIEHMRESVITPLEEGASEFYGKRNSINSIILTGSHGVGKTAVSHSLAQEIQKQTGKDVFVGTMDCSKYASKFSGEHLQFIGADFDNILRTALSHPDKHFVLIVDECGQIFNKIKNPMGGADNEAVQGLELIKSKLNNFLGVNNITFICTTNERQGMTKAGELTLGNMEENILNRLGGMSSVITVENPDTKSLVNAVFTNLGRKYENQTLPYYLTEIMKDGSEQNKKFRDELEKLFNQYNESNEKADYRIIQRLTDDACNCLANNATLNKKAGNTNLPVDVIEAFKNKMEVLSKNLSNLAENAETSSQLLSVNF